MSLPSQIQAAADLAEHAGHDNEIIDELLGIVRKQEELVNRAIAMIIDLKRKLAAATS